MYTAVTEGIRVEVTPVFLEDQSDPAQHQYVWAYQVEIENRSNETVQLLSRYWKITDAEGQVHEVQGDGVVGEQPVLGEGDAFEYTSGTPLNTPSGIMEGRYRMKTNKGREFDVEIPAFSLDSPYGADSVH